MPRSISAAGPMIFCALFAFSVRGVAAADTSHANVDSGNTKALFAFRDGLAEISRKNHVGFVIEGEPQPIVLIKRAARPAPASDAEKQTSTEALLATYSLAPTASPLEAEIWKFANSYDYDLQRKGALFLLRKKHTYPSDVPDVTPDECYLATSEMNRLIESLSHQLSGHEQTALLEGLVASLTPDQWKILSKKGYLLTQADLTRSQRADVLAFVLHMYTTGGRSSGMATWLLNPAASPGFRRGAPGKENDDRVGGIVTTQIGDKSRVDFVPLAFDTRQETDPEVVGAERAAVVDSLEFSPAAHITVTLGQAVEALNRRRKDQTPEQIDSTYTFHVDLALSAKPVTLIGSEVASPIKVAASIAAVYGLRLQRAPSAPTVDNITRIAAPALDEPTDMSEIAHQLFPAPLLSALQVDREDVLRAMPTYNNPENEQQVESMRHKFDLQLLIEEHRHRVIQASARQLFAFLDRTLPPCPGPGTPSDSPLSLPLTKTAAFAQALYSVYTLDGFVGGMDLIMYPPLTVSHFDQTCLICSPNLTNKESPKAAIGIGMYDAARNACGMVVIKTSVPLPPNAPVAAQ